MILAPRRLLAIWLLCCCACLAHAASVVIVLADVSAPYVEAADAVTGQLQQAGVAPSEIVRLGASELAGLGAAELASTKVWLALGTESLRQTLAKGARSPVLAAMLPRAAYQRVLLERGDGVTVPTTALYLDQPFARQLSMLHLALPDARRVGVLWGEESKARQPGLQAAASAHSLELSSAVVANDAALFGALKNVLERSDVLLAVPDPRVFNGATLPNILLTTYRARVPVLAFSPTYVKAGALLSLHTTPVQVGRQAGALALSVLQGAVVPPAQYPAEFSVTVNAHVARSLGLSLDATMLEQRLRALEQRP